MQFYLITKAAELANVAVNTVRDYCRHGYLDPIRDSAGRRLFTDEDVAKVREIYFRNTGKRPGEVHQ